MISIVNNVHDNELIQLEKYYTPSDIVLFDIETTGFAAEATDLYLIGCCYYENGNWLIRQWFNDDGISEMEILNDFTSFISNYKYILHYNGDGFDIPYVKSKLSKYNCPFEFDKIESIDLYKNLRHYKECMHLENLKQKSLEKYLGIKRLDKYSGGDLIKVYKDYLNNKNETNKTLLIQHNYDDLEGLLYCCSLLSFPKMKAGCINVKKMSVRQERLLFSLTLDYDLPKRITLGRNDILITAYKNEATINAGIVSEELKFFFDNYKDYYYLPAEDMAVHKSVATYVDRFYREPARKSNCYSRKQGYFISQIDEGIISGYKRNYNDKESFIELTDSFLQDIDMLNAYARYVIQKFL